MTSLNLKAIDTAELMPLSEVTDSFGPRNEDERRVLKLVKESLELADPSMD